MKIGDLVWSIYHKKYGIIVERYNSPVSVYDGYVVEYVDGTRDNEFGYELEAICK